MISKRAGAPLSRPVELALAAGVALALLATALLVPSPASALKFEQPGCSKLQKRVGKTTGAKKRAAKRNLAQCQANAKVYKQVRNSHFVGTRADGVEIDTIYCANGKWQDDVADGGDVGTNGWRIVDAKLKRGGNRFTAAIEAWIPGGKHSQGVIRDGDRWQIGYEFGGEVKSPGDVERTDARAACAAL